MRKQNGKIAAVVASQQCARVAHNKSGKHVDQRKVVLFGRCASPVIAQQVEIRQADHHYDAV